MKVKDWLYDLMNNYYVDYNKDGELVILPIERDNNESERINE